MISKRSQLLAMSLLKQRSTCGRFGRLAESDASLLSQECLSSVSIPTLTRPYKPDCIATSREPDRSWRTSDSATEAFIFPYTPASDTDRTPSALHLGYPSHDGGSGPAKPANNGARMQAMTEILN